MDETARERERAREGENDRERDCVLFYCSDVDTAATAEEQHNMAPSQPR